MRKTSDEKNDLKVLEEEKKSLENLVKETKKDFKEVKESQKMKEIKRVNQKILDENYVLKANMEKLKSSQKQKPFDFEEQI